MVSQMATQWPINGNACVEQWSCIGRVVATENGRERFSFGIIFDK